ncbi:MAG TPA: TetR-like C-terminal domain-containing protein [Streptosporangiaceae bacterium]
MDELAGRMQEQVAAVPGHRDAKQAAIARLAALGVAYLDFATRETGLFETAFAVPRHLEYAAADDTAGGHGPTPFQLLGSALDELVTAGVLPAERRPDAEYPVWSSVHGMTVLITQGPLRGMPPQFVRHLTDHPPWTPCSSPRPISFKGRLVASVTCAHESGNRSPGTGRATGGVPSGRRALYGRPEAAGCPGRTGWLEARGRLLAITKDVVDHVKRDPAWSKK